MRLLALNFQLDACFSQKVAPTLLEDCIWISRIETRKIFRDAAFNHFLPCCCLGCNGNSIELLGDSKLLSQSLCSGLDEDIDVQTVAIAKIETVRTHDNFAWVEAP